MSNQFKHIDITTLSRTELHALIKEMSSALKQRLENGEDFTLLARTNSEDRGSAISGGDLDWVQPGALVPAFETAMNALEINQISLPVQTQFGWHLIQVLGREQQDNTQLMRRSQARSQLQKRKADAAIETWLTKLRDEAYVEYRLNN
jgi:peptidyl-prolyl cis-trans isomerase SurA